MKRTAIYMRVSTTQQVEEGDSIAAQRDALRKYIDSHNDLIFAGEYLDDGISGTKEDRDELQHMLADVKAGKIDLIICTRMDRLHRSLRNFLNMQDTLERHHCNWLAIWEPMYDTSTPQGKMIINTMMNLAQFEAENTGSRIRQVQAYKLTKGEVISGTTSPGYKIVDKHLVPNEDAQNVIETFRYFSLTGSMTKTLRHCHDMHGIPRSMPGLKKMLKRTIYIGIHHENENFCPPLINKDLFYDVQRKLKINVKNNQKEVYIFSGLITCTDCDHKMGASLRIFHRQKGDVRTHFYKCMQHYKPVRDCVNSKMIREHILERYLLDNLKHLISAHIEYSRVKYEPVRNSKNRILTIEKKINRLKELYINELITIDEYKSDKEKYQEEIKAIQSEETQQEPNTEALEKIMGLNLEEMYADLTAEEKRFFWRSIIREIQFDSERNVRIFFY